MRASNIIIIFVSCMAFLLGSCTAESKKQKTILVVSGWQDINIGDIAHTPGLLQVLEKSMPDAKIIVWKKSASKSVDELLKRHFPKIDIVNGSVGEDYAVTSPEVLEAIKKADILIHGSGPSVLAENYIRAWNKLTQKPYGVFATTIQEINPELKELLQGAAFVFTRETASLENLKKSGINKPKIMFIPDATFSVTIRNDEKNKLFMDSMGLGDKGFICVIPRYRKTPYESYSKELLEEIKILNDSCKEKDHSKLREMMIKWVRTTNKKVVVCPEMTYEVGIMDELLIDPLPEDVKPYIIKHDYWYPDEAVSLYSHACCVVSLECHSPILALSNGTPAFYIRQKEDTIKGQMYYDLGFNDWIFEIDETTGSQISDRLMTVYNAYESTQSYLKAGMQKSEKLLQAGAVIVKDILY